MQLFHLDEKISEQRMGEQARTEFVNMLPDFFSYSLRAVSIAEKNTLELFSNSVSRLGGKKSPKKCDCEPMSFV